MRGFRILAASALVLAGCASPSASPSLTESQSTAPSPTQIPSAAASVAPATPAWQELTPSGETPSAREDHTWTTNADATIAYLFGGRTSDGAVLGDLWAYDVSANAWSLLPEQGPPARFGHNAAWVPGIGLVIFAGQAGATFYNDLWAFDPATAAWSQLPAGDAVPVPRYGSCAAIGPDGRLWISHGFTQGGQRFADTRAYDFSTRSWTDETPAAEAPVQRCLHACWWTDDGKFALYAGQTTGTNSLGDLWWLSVGERPGTNVWEQMTIAEGRPPARNLYAASSYRGDEVVFGGQGLDGAALADTWWLASDGSVYPVTASGATPPGRWGAELVADASEIHLLLFGGRDAGGAYDDLWELTLDGTGG
jgi:hypothetical protein